MGEVIYEAQHTNGVISICYIFYCITCILISLYLLINWKKTDIPTRCFIIIVIAFLSLIMIVPTYNDIDAKRKVYNEYKEGNYLIAEGYITDFDTSYDLSGEATYDSFIVSNVVFQTPGFCTQYGYPLQKSTGSVLSNGVNVRIYYVTYKFENVIMHLEIIE